jgi:hypothetical protein
VKKFMPSPYQEFVRKAKERFLEKQKRKATGAGGYVFTLHAQYKMKQYGLSEQRVRSVIRNPKRREEGIVPKTVAVMQPVSLKNVNGKEVWKQEIWVMYVVKNQELGIKNQEWGQKQQKSRIISAWRYPGVSPKRHPIPDEILRELEEGSIIEPYEDVSY